MNGLPGALIDALLKGSLLLVLAAAVTRLLPHRSAAARHAVWTTALLAQLALPVLSANLPTWDVPLLPAARAESVSPPRQVPVVEYPASTGGRSLFESLSPAHRVFGWLWIVGSVLLLARIVVGMAAVARLARRATEVVSGPWHHLTHYFSTTLRIRRPIRLLRSDRLSVPVTWGVRRPTLLLPAEADGWSAERRGLVLVHELAHIKRLDALTQLAAHGALVLFWINPLVWIAMRQMAAERERACDDYVLRCGAVASTYAEELLEIVRSLRRTPGPALATLALGLARRSDFEGRMLAILNPRVSRQALDRRVTLALGLLALLLAVPLAAFRLVPRTVERPVPPVVASRPVAAYPLGPRALMYERSAVPMLLLDTAISRPPLSLPVPTTPRTPPTPWKGKTLAFELLPKSDTTMTFPPADPNGDSRLAPRGTGAGDYHTTVCVSYSLASFQDDRRSLRGEAPALRTPPPDFHWAISNFDPTARCTVTVQLVSTERLPSSQKLSFILAWENQEQEDEASSAKHLERILQTPEVLELLRYLTPPPRES